MLKSAIIAGRHHRHMQQNGQDHALTGTTRDGSIFGLVADGCGSKYQGRSGRHPSHNEVGAKLLSSFVAGRLQREPLSEKGLKQVIDGLLQECVRFLAELTEQVVSHDPARRQRFIATHLLATLLGFVITEEQAVLFWLGDGYLLHDGQIEALCADNHPDYPAYRLYPELSTQAMPSAFHMKMLPRRGLYQLGVATDGWSPALLAGMDPTATTRQLQRWMNVCSRGAGCFEDDGAIALCVLP